MPRKVLRLQTLAVCGNCNDVYVIKDLVNKIEQNSSSVVFSAKRASCSIYCPSCSSFNFKLHYEYKNVYRIRCVKCNEMFDCDDTYHSRCSSCEKEHLIALSQMGA